MKTKYYRKTALNLLRIAVIIIPLGWIYKQTDSDTLLFLLKEISPAAIAVIVTMEISTILLQGLRWWFLIKRFVPELKILKTLKIHLISSFYSIVLPTSAAQDVLRAVMLSKNYSPTFIWASSWLVRLIGLSVLMILSLTGALLMSQNTLPDNFKLPFFSLFFLILFLTAASFSKKITRPFRTFFQKLPLISKVNQSIEAFREGIYTYKKAPGTIASSFLLTIFTQLFIVFKLTIVIYSISGEFYFVQCLIFIPLIELISISLPLTPGGIGVREALSAIMFSHLGLSADQLGIYAFFTVSLSLIRGIGVIPVIYDMIRGTKRELNDSTPDLI